MKAKSRFANTFIIALIIGLATHMYRFTNWMLCEDSLNYLDSISKSWVTSIGRFLLPLVEDVRGNYELSWLIGLLSVIFLSTGAAVIVTIFDIEGPVRRIFTAWIVVANPVVTSTFAYMYTADGYCFGFMLVTLFVYFINKYDRQDNKKKNLILGILALSCSMAFYQGYVTAAVILIFIKLLDMLLDKEYEVKDVLLKGVRFLVCAIIAAVIYYIGMNIAWKLGGYKLTGYMGVGEKPTMGIIRYWYELKECYIDFARVFLVRWEWTSYNVMNIIMFAFTGIIIVIEITKNHFWKKPLRWLLSLLILVLLPVGSHAFEFLSESVSYTTTIMEYGTMMVFLIPVVLLGKFSAGDCQISDWKDLKFVKKHVFPFAAMILLFCICFNFTVIANKAYYSMFMANKNCELLINRVEMRLEELDEYDPEGNVMIVGSQYQIPEYVSSAPMMSGVVSNIFLITDTEYVSYLNKMASTSYGTVSWDKQVEIANTEEFKEMPKWPAKGSVKTIDGVMVVVLSYQNVDEFYE